jgi:CHAD domain-containing protein
MAKKAKPVWHASRSAAENARTVLPRLAAEYLKSGAALAAKQPSPRELHKFRIKSKRFRYTLELFLPLYGPGLEARLEALRRIQQHLGEINDCVAARRLLAATEGAPAGQKEGVVRLLNARLAAQTEQLRRHLREVFAAPNERWWTDYLARFAGRGRAWGRSRSRR